jgi:UDP-N-acetylglucosamine 4,6-dehydratase/UDP-glucose 4-epimerase
MLTDATILITGATGSVGTLLTDHLLATDVGTIRLFDADEAGLATARSSLDDDRCRFLTGDGRAETNLRCAMADVDIVIHAAAMTHVDVVEYNPFEAVKTNVIGTQHVIETAIEPAGIICGSPLDAKAPVTMTWM